MNEVETTSKQKRALQLSFLVILLTNFFRLVGISVAEISLPYIILGLSGTLFSFGLVIGVFYLTQSIFQVPFSLISDKYGRKKIMLIGIIIFTIGTFLCFIAQNIIELIFFRALQGVGAYSAILQAITSDIYKEEEQGKGMSYYIISYTLGYFGGISLGGYVTFFLGIRSGFFISGILIALSGVLILFFYHEEHAIQQSSLDLQDNSVKTNFNLAVIKLLLKDRQFSMIVIISSIRWLIFGGIVSYIIWILEVQFHLNSIQTSFILILTVVMYIVFVGITGKFIKKWGSKLLMLLGQAIIVMFGLLYILVDLTGNLPLYIFASVISGIGLGIFETAVATATIDKVGLIDINLKSTGFGISNTIGFLCSAIGPIIITLLGSIFLFLPYYFMLFLILISFLITLKFVKK